MSKKSYDRRKKLKKNLKTKKQEQYQAPVDPPPDYVSPILKKRVGPGIAMNSKEYGVSKKYSDVIIEFAEAWKSIKESKEMIKGNVELGIILWNAFTLKQHGDEELIHTMAEHFDNNVNILEIFDYFEKRKNELFGEYDFFVEDYEIEFNAKNQVILSVSVTDYKLNILRGSLGGLPTQELLDSIAKKGSTL